MRKSSKKFAVATLNHHESHVLLQDHLYEILISLLVLDDKTVERKTFMFLFFLLLAQFMSIFY